MKTSKAICRQPNPKNSSHFRHQLYRNIPLYLMLIIPMAYIIIFCYVPMAGIVAAFKKFSIFQSIWECPWVGFTYFKEAFHTKAFWEALKNTLILNLGDQLFIFPLPIILAVLMNELRSEKMKKVSQTIMYLPHFLSTVIIVGIIYQVFSGTGVVNNVLTSLGFDAVDFLGNSWNWRFVYWGSALWAGAGYGMIVYLAAMAGINTELYDAAYIDGASRWQRIWHVTLPQIKPTIITILIMDMGKLFSIGFEKPYLMGNVMVKDASEVISTYVYSVGLQGGRYDFATAIGLFQSVIALILVLGANWFAKKIGEEGLI